ncbi:hypothetical protein Bresa_03113|uniref:Uncharacterized protein n=1 Tax=Brenneria salicis ATCC 15712 = DSM 30166 TaxID=714314 RepID=A0A366I7X8_9GAMM|nr:hypothetical protein [Brenneria salicis]NMN92778.1 hypothetical protein [Brenneria salicis ATCC 15712 = DSM 30166]RBP63755.1 hypothetical protein DES54_11054 [Brenneria salicis ATCC 15712 = DSM 30166]RLM31040.1 hypothetical protein BHG07_07505 [Brenneria salicis ATCC 15712 = DSM 30166]
MCGVCGLLDSGPKWSDPLQRSRPRYQQRQQQLAVLNQVLAPFRLKLNDFHQRWMLAGPTGQQVIVDTLDQLWPQAEKIIRRSLDPLDDGWLAALESKGA